MLQLLFVKIFKKTALITVTFSCGVSCFLWMGASFSVFQLGEGLQLFEFGKEAY